MGTMSFTIKDIGPMQERKIVLGSANFFVDGQRVNISIFVGNTVFITTILLL